MVGVCFVCNCDARVHTKLCISCCFSPLDVRSLSDDCDGTNDIVVEHCMTDGGCVSACVFI